jgi:TM2 domain-containing membrane protein YozV
VSDFEQTPPNSDPAIPEPPAPEQSTPNFTTPPPPPPFAQPVDPQPNYQYAPPQPQPVQPQWQGLGSPFKDKWVAAVLAFFLGSLGIHKFYLGYKNEGIITLVITIVGSCCFGIGPLVMWIIAIIEGVRYVTLTQQDFEQSYVINRKGWF